MENPNFTTNTSGDYYLSMANMTMCYATKPKTYQEVLEYLNLCFQESEKGHWISIVMQHMKQRRQQAKLSTPVLVPLLLMYTMMILVGTLGSSLVIFVVLTKRQMHSPRNIFILNVAITDFILCIFSQPFNLIRLLSQHKEWVYGDILCKMVAFFTGTNMFVSTMSISAIALDRYYVIMYPTKKSLNICGAIIVIFLIWILAFILASPLPLFSHVDSVNKTRFECTEISFISAIQSMKLAYSIFGMLFHCLVPLVILLFVYSRIYKKMKDRLRHQHPNKSSLSAQNENLLRPSDSQTTEFNAFAVINEKKQLAEANRQRKVNILLFSIAIVFAFSWLPLNITNLVMEIDLFIETNYNVSQNSPTTSVNYTQTVTIIQAICLLLVLSSACTNPVLYCWLNESFRYEFQKLVFWKKQSDNNIRDQTMCTIQSRQSRIKSSL